MNKTLKGIVVQIGGDTSGLTRALQSLNDKIYSTTGELKEVNRLLKFNPQSTTLLKQKHELLAKSIKATSDKLKELKNAEKAVQDEVKKGNIAESEYRAFQREIASTEGYLKSLEKQAKVVNISLEKIGSTMSNAGKALTIGVTTPVIAAGAAIYKYSSDLTEAENKTKEVFKNMSGDVLAWSETSLDKMGMARSTALDAASLYGGMATAMGLTRKKATDMSKSLTELSVDLASFHNTSLDQASTALKSIFTGETETLKNYGIVMTEANLKAYALSQGIKTNYTEMTQAEKVQLRYNFVLNASKDAIGDYERNCGEAASQMKKLPEALKELATSFKDNVEPAITPVITALNGAIVSFGKWSKTTKNVVTVTAVTIAALGPLVSIVGKTTSAIGKAEKAFAKIYAWIKKKTAATVEDTAANAANARSLDKTAESAETAAKSTGKIETAAKSATPYLVSVASSLTGIAIASGTILQYYASKYSDAIEKNYSEKIEKSNKAHDVEIQNLTDEYNIYEDKMSAKKSTEEKYWNDKISNLSKDLKAQKSAISQEQKLYEKAHKERLSQLEKEKQAKLDVITAGEAAQTAEIQQQIDTLNALNEADEAATKEQENAEKLAELKKQITFAKTYAAKVDAENAYTAEVKRQEEEKTKVARENQIKQLQNKIEQIKSESAARQEQVKSEYDKAAELENSKYEIAKEGFENRLSALDTFIEDETARLEAARDEKIAIMQSETDSYLAELQKRIDKQNELKEAAEKRLEAEKKEEENSRNFLEKAYLGAQGLRDWFGDIQSKTKVGEFFKKINSPDFQQNLINKLSGHNAAGTNDWKGGLTYVNERGGELINLPRHAQIIPHDISMEMAREYGRMRAAYTTNNDYTTTTSNTYNQYGAQQQVNVFSVDGKTVTEVIEPRVSVMMSDNIYRRRRSGGK